MSWYYAGPEGKPAGPVTREELQIKRSEGIIGPETYVLENTGQPGTTLAWKRYREAFPTLTLPPAAPLPVLVPTPPAHPLFPSANIPQPLAVAAAPEEPRTNPWCLWGMILGIGSLLFFICGVGILLAPIASLLCVVGIVQIQSRPKESGWGLAAIGLCFSSLAMLLTLIAIIWFSSIGTKFQAQTATEETTNDSD